MKISLFWFHALRDLSQGEQKVNKMQVNEGRQEKVPNAHHCGKARDIESNWLLLLRLIYKNEQTEAAQISTR